VPEHSFFGWPWYYMGGKLDPRLKDPCANGSGPNPQLAAPLTDEQANNCKRESLAAKVKTPDVLVQPHMASLEMVFYPTKGGVTYQPVAGQKAVASAPNFPAAYYGGAFAAEHGSWNRKNRAGYNVIFIPMQNGKATGEYDDFLDGFVTKDGQVWGRPVGVAVANDGSLFVTDDGTRSVWHVTYEGK
jgi:glucose/arabinose dehydrogenase